MDEPEVEINYVGLESDTTCDICLAEFLDLDDLQIHRRQMHPTGLLLCQFCSQIQASAEDYAVHIRDKHLTDLRMCQFCTRVFIDEYYCKKHQQKHLICSENAMYSCSQCNLKFSNVSELEKHEFNTHKTSDVTEGLWLQEHMPHLSSVFNMNFISLLLLINTRNKCICSNCGTSARTMEGYVEHLKSSDCRSLACNTCYNVYKTRKGLIKHLGRHPGCNYIVNKNSMRTCTECFKEVGVHLWKYHKRKCRPFKCNKCQIVFETMEALSKHQTKEHPLVVSLEYCKYCKKEFVGTVAVEKHIERSHKVELYKYPCVYCDMVFQHPQKLFAHFFSKHKDIEPYWCKICDKKFKIRKNFTIHIKLEHKSVGFVEFNEKFHVYFTDKKSDKAKTDISTSKSTKGKDANIQNIDITQESDTNAESVDTQDKPDTIESLDAAKQTDTDMELEKPGNASNLLIEIDKYPINSDIPTETDAQTDAPTDIETKRSVRPKRMTKSQKVKLEKRIEIADIGSDSSDDEPLLTLKTKIKKGKGKQRTRRVFKSLKDNRRRFTCKFCKTYCYTFQNYHHHMNTVHENEKVQCVKCLQVFSSKAKLADHIKNEHSSSKLTETLKNILAKRNSGVNDNSSMSNAINDSLTNTEKFLKTIKKVDFDISEEQATLAPLSKGISVQKFIENFIPEQTEPKKEIVIESHITIKNVNGPEKQPFIKMTKFQPKTPVTNSIRTKLAMPVKFKEDSEQHKVTVKVVEAEERPLFIEQYQTETYYDNHDFDHYEEMVTEEKSEHIPEVAQEVMLEVSEETPKAPVHKVVIPKLPKEIGQIRIATLLPEAPYYKILKIDDVLKNSAQQAPQIKEEKEVVLPNGTKLVNVNPLAHLLGDTTVEKVFENMPSYKYYQPKKVDFEKAVAKALMNEKPPPKKKRKTKVEP